MRTQKLDGANLSLPGKRPLNVVSGRCSGFQEHFYRYQFRYSLKLVMVDGFRFRVLFIIFAWIVVDKTAGDMAGTCIILSVSQ